MTSFSRLTPGGKKEVVNKRLQSFTCDIIHLKGLCHGCLVVHLS